MHSKTRLFTGLMITYKFSINAEYLDLLDMFLTNAVLYNEI